MHVFNLVDFNASDGYNPFRYLRDDKDVLKLITNLIRNTTPKTAGNSDPFWEKAETALLEALMFYLMYEAPPEEQNFGMIMKMISYADIREEDSAHISPLDLLFQQLSYNSPGHIAAKQYAVYKQAAGVVCSKRLLNQSDWKSLRTHRICRRKQNQVPILRT